LTRDTRAAFSGKAKQFIESSGGMVGLVVMAFVFIYLVLSAQFGSFLDPFIILFAVPFSMVGALLFLKLGGGTFNLYSQIGIVTLIGLISKHGILITQFINQLRRDGETMTAAIISGASIRLRPILMTTAAMVFGTLPLMLASGPGSIGRQQIGLVVVGGLICGTFFSLVVVPIIYSILGRWKRLPTKA
jgi:multidrug efflux pump subunit AcrB